MVHNVDIICGGLGDVLHPKFSDLLLKQGYFKRPSFLVQFGRGVVLLALSPMTAIFLLEDRTDRPKLGLLFILVNHENWGGSPYWNSICSA